MFDHSSQHQHSLRFVIVAALFISFTSSANSVQLAPTVRLNNGYEIPIVGLGTYNSGPKPGEAEQAVKDAIDAGYRHIDTAFLYGNEVEVGRGVRAKIDENVVKREDMFITTKLWSTFHEPDQVERAFQKSLDNLNLTYIDLYLMHSPIAYQRVSKDGQQVDPPSIDDVNLFPVDASGKTLKADVDYMDTWRAMEGLVKSGRARSIGVSNFNSEQVDRVYREGEIKPVTNQVECHPNLNQRRLLSFMADRNITLTAYSPLGRPHAGGKDLAIADPKVKAIADKYGKSPAHVVLKYSIQNGAIVIPKSTNKDRIKSNIELFDFVLSEDDMQILHSLNSNTRLLDFSEERDHKYYPFSLEF